MRTVIDIDEEALKLATEELGTTTKVATVNAALRRVAEQRASRLMMADHLLLDLDLEMAYSARNADDHTKLIARQRAARWLPVTEAVMDRSLEVVAMLARRGQHRTPIPDVMIAATAEHHEATVLHVDEDYDQIAAVTGQPMRRLATSN